MADITKIHTSDLPDTLNQEFYSDLVENFTIIKSALTEITVDLDQLSKKYGNINKKDTSTQLITDTGKDNKLNGPITIDINDNDSHTMQ